MNTPQESAPDASATPVPTSRPYDPERGLRGVMSATLILEAIVVLLAIPVAKNTGTATGTIGVILICLLAVALIGACALVSRPYFLHVALSLQALIIIGWLITPSLGVMGIVFSVVWGVVIWFRNEFRRRLAAGTLPGPTPPAGGAAQ